jgi:hypothetical protein
VIDIAHWIDCAAVSQEVTYFLWRNLSPWTTMLRCHQLSLASSPHKPKEGASQMDSVNVFINNRYPNGRGFASWHPCIWNVSKHSKYFNRELRVATSNTKGLIAASLFLIFPKGISWELSAAQCPCYDASLKSETLIIIFYYCIIHRNKKITSHGAAKNVAQFRYGSSWQILIGFFFNLM